jgi:rhomboid protease GluP
MWMAANTQRLLICHHVQKIPFGMMKPSPSRLIAVPVLTVVLLIAGIYALLQPDILQFGAVESEAVRRGEIYRVVLAMFLHLNALHLWLNLMLLWFIGVSLEQHTGYRTTFVLFFAGGLAGSLLHVFVETGGLRAVGASTGIYALLGAEILRLHHARNTLSRLERWYLYSLIALAGGGIILGLIVNTMSLPVQAGNAGHIGGLLVGIAGGWWITRKISPFQPDK